ncbi:ribonuclease HIII [Ureaplasma miroungigenitalium]|uniref:ribonuclease HIII n=1 Tax=Ureaplasma miroungigenitalium TaxID=1042321 RepID=UPI0021E719AB|nr:ribonuclease HIII [Ureaplasma miroungigenitalium]MCV3734017.1 ribonuclease HIII [Ureaplasma miroungigenitalium]
MRTWSVKIDENQYQILQKTLQGYEQPYTQMFVRQRFGQNECFTIFVFNSLKVVVNLHKNYEWTTFLSSFPTINFLSPINDEQEDQNELHEATIGSDEVGVGDFFHGLVVCAVYLPKSQIPFVRSLQVNDSKKINDRKILELAKILKEKVDFVIKFFDPYEYNENYRLYKNAHVLKTILHNQAISRLLHKYPRTYTVIDQYVSQAKFKEYEKQANLEHVCIKKSINKAESQFLSVACASIIARAFLLNFKSSVERKYHIALPLGADNEKIREATAFILHKYKPGFLYYLAKAHFKNFPVVKNHKVK